MAVVTGANGFCGRHLTDHLLAAGYDVVGVDSAGAPDNDPSIRRLDILDTDGLTRLFADVKPCQVYHLAALTNPRLAYADLHRVNALGTLSLLGAVRESCPEATVLVTSSSAVYGRVDPGDLPIREEQPFSPVSAYAISKIAQEMVAYQQHAEHGLRVIRVRPFNLTGPGESIHFVTSALARQVAEIAAGHGAPVLTTGNLDTTRDFTDVRDAVGAYRLLAERGQPGLAYNVCSGRGIVIRTILDQLVEIAGIPKPVVNSQDFHPTATDVPVQIGDATGLASCTGWTTTFSIRSTLQDALDSWRDRVGGCSAVG